VAEPIDLQLTAMAHGGAALGRHEGQTIFVPYAIPGERVRAELLEAHAHWARARLLEVLEPSPYRVPPPCPYFGPDRCGGCQFQHIDYDTQVELKRQVIIDQLGRIGGLPGANVQEAIGAAEPWHYRNHAQFAVTENGHVAFQRAGSHQLIPVESCLIIDPLLDDLWSALDIDWPQLRQLTLRCGSATGDLMAIFESDHYEDFDIEVDFPVSCVVRLADGESVVLMGNPYLVEQVAGRDYRVLAGSFFQVNTAGAEVLVELVQGYLAPKGSETLVDLYCGVGLFGLALAGRVGRVIGVEADLSAADDFRYNVQGLPNVQLLASDAGAALPTIEGPLRDGLVVLDPPRAGAGTQVIAEIARLEPQRIVYVACDPATLARDARQLVDAGYRLAEVQLVDLFPQTYHIESVALFVR
jgi:23S rRNA (uracil1939-C5)-methyltransferase